MTRIFQYRDISVTRQHVIAGNTQCLLSTIQSVEPSVRRKFWGGRDYIVGINGNFGQEALVAFPSKSLADQFIQAVADASGGVNIVHRESSWSFWIGL